MIWRALFARLASLLARLRRRSLLPPPAVPDCPAPPTLALVAPRSLRTALDLPAVICLPGPPPASVAAPEPRQRAPRKESVTRLKADVLDKLDAYLVYIKRLKRWDKESYTLYRRLGAYICHPHHEAHIWELEPAVVKTLPAFGAVALGIANREEETEDGVGKDPYLPMRFAYFTRLQKPGRDVELVNQGTTYRCHFYWDNDKATDKFMAGRGHGFGDDMVVNVLPDGTIRALRMLKVERQVIRHKHGEWRGHSSTVNHQRWGLPDFSDDKTKDEWWKRLTMAERIRSLFCMIANFWLVSARHSMIRVTATKDGIVMPFVVDATQTPQFFRDREPVVINGVRKRIFHVVRAHTRAGATKGVRLHFAGLREFTWNGYQIAITVPGFDHLDVADASFGAIEDMLPEDVDEKTIGLEEFAELIADRIGAPNPPEPGAPTVH